jgi:hypothetical protein
MVARLRVTIANRRPVCIGRGRFGLGQGVRIRGDVMKALRRMTGGWSQLGRVPAFRAWVSGSFLTRIGSPTG